MDKAKRQLYITALEQIAELLPACADSICAMSSVSAILHSNFPLFYWTGFYRVVAPELLVVGPYQGTPACLEIPFSRGVCGHCASTGKTVIVEDVHQFPGHIACDSRSQSEIVVPVFSADGRLQAVLDIDSTEKSAFDAIDRQYLEKICELLRAKL